MPTRLLAIFALISVVATSASDPIHAQSQTPAKVATSIATNATGRVLPPATLPGYGKLSAAYYPLNTDTSQLSIQTETVAKAQRVHAKFLSDLHRFPGVSTGTMQIMGRQIETHEAQGQGMIVAVREGTRVRIFTAPDPERLAIQLRAAHLAPGGVTRREVQLPKIHHPTTSGRVAPQGSTRVVFENRTTDETGRLRSKNQFVLLRSSLSDNGLYDVWTLWNQSLDKSQKVTIEFAAEHPQFVIDMRDGKSRELANSSLENIRLQPLETIVLLTPRRQLAQAPLYWFGLLRQRGSRHF